MKADVMDVLFHLFERYIAADDITKLDKACLVTDLERVGFPKQAISKAFSWLDNMKTVEVVTKQDSADSVIAIRHYTRQEMNKFNTECRGYLLFLEQIGLLNPVMREIVIDSVMILDLDEIELEQIHLIVLMALLDQSEQEKRRAYGWVDSVAFKDTKATVH